MQPLTDAEQKLYDDVDQEGLGAKVSWLQGEMDAMIAGSELTAPEQREVVELLQQNVT